MLRVLRAFAWLRWRTLVNSLERRTSRDLVQRFSVAVEQIAPVMIALVMIPSALAIGLAGAHAGWSLARGDAGPPTFEALRFLLLAGTGFAILAPVVLPRSERTHLVRLLILPIPRGLLYLAQAVSAAADPWMLLAAAALLAIPLGLLAGGAVAAAAVAALAGAMLLVVLVGLTLTATSLVHLAVRSRRRGELLALALMLLLPGIFLLPSIIGDEADRRSGRGLPGDNVPPSASRVAALGERAMTILPSELYVRATREAAGRQHEAALGPVAGLAAAGTLLHLAAFGLFIGTLGSPGGLSGARGGPSRVRMLRITGLSPATAAVAHNQIRLALRTPRGRSSLLSPLVVFAMFAAMLARTPSGLDFGLLTLQNGLALATVAGFVSLLAILPLAMNQFAIDGAGLTLTFLAPVETRALLIGKAIGNAVIVAMPAAATVTIAYALFPVGDLALWLCIPIGLGATYLLVAPIAAALSAVFPRKVDMNSIGQGSNAHGAAGFAGLAACVAAGLPCLGIVLIATRVLEAPALGPVLLLIWTAVCALVCGLLLAPVEALLDRRREQLVMGG